MHPQLERCYDLAIRGAWSHPFFLIPLGHCEWHEADPKVVQTASVRPVVKNGVAGIELHLNPEFIAGVPDDQIFGLLAHEILHCMLQHHERGGGKREDIWGQATDMAINASLASSGIKVPDGAIMPPNDHAEDAAEELYTLLETEEIKKPKNYDPNHVGRGCRPSKTDPQGENQAPGDEPGDQDGSGQGDGSGESEGEGNSPGQGQQDQGNGDRAWGELNAQAQVMSRGTGSAKILAKLFTPKPIKTKWDRLLKKVANRAMSKGGRDNQTWSKVNRRSTDIILPGWNSSRPSVAAIIDSSGSVSDDMLRSALTSVKECAKASGVRVFLAVHAYDCYFADWIKPETTVQEISKLCTDRGGTDPRQAFVKVGEAHGKFDACVYLTDGEVGTYPDKPQNVKRMIVGVLGDRNSAYRAAIPDTWQEVLVEIDGDIG